MNNPFPFSPATNCVIKITRGSENFGVFRKLKVFIDDSHAGDLLGNETVAFSVAPGNHNVYVKMDWCRSPVQTVHVSEPVVEFYVTVVSDIGDGTIYRIYKQYFHAFFNPSTFSGLKKLK